ncbi:hypothetical protein PI126_g11839 [Phytophthora idaei]|nr:hypothetical protein PI126_g11839 [Phytophthora idaei]
MASVVPLPPSIDELPPEVLAIGASVSASFVDPLELQNSIQRAGRALLKVIDAANLSSECQSSLAVMAASGQALELRFVEEIQNTEVLAGPFQESAVKHIAELREAMANCATKSSVPVVELLSLCATDQAKEATGFIKLTASEIFDSPYAKAIAAQGFAGMDGVLGQSRDVIDAALDAVRDGGTAAFSAFAACLASSGLPPLLRVEIARDFFQTVGLFFNGLYVSVLDFFGKHQVANGLNNFLKGLRGAYDVMAVNVLALIDKASQNRALLVDFAVGILLTAIGIVYVSFLWFAFSGRHLHRRADEVRQGHEAVTWAVLAKKQKMRVKLFTYVITACLTVYLPLTRLCLDVLVAAAMNRSTSDDSEATSASDLILSRFKDAKAWPAIVVAAVVLLLTFTIPLPWLLVRAIAENRPTGSLEDPLVTHDLDGEIVPFDDKVYARLVARDPSQLRCPYRSLYAGFEQKWSYYKVLQLLVKLALALVIVLAATADDRIRGILSCAIYVTVVAISRYGTPFSDPLNNVMEISGKITALTTCVGGALAAFIDMKQAKSKPLELVAAIVSVVHIVNFFVMLVVLLLGMKGARLFLKNLLGRITFSDTSRGLEDAPAKNVLPRWDVDKEAKHRIGGFGTSSRRVGSPSCAFTLDWRRTSKLRQATRSALEGVDVFWDDASGARDGHLDSKSFFGKMYVLPYPFHCVMVYDDSKDEAVIRDQAETPAQSKLAKLLFLNFSPKIVAKRDLRQKLRVLSAQATNIDFPFSRQEQATVEDGTVTRTDSEGNSHTETRYSTVSFTCYHTYGVIHVATKGDTNKRIMAEGFDVTMTYRDGHGDAVAPHTGKVHHLQNRVASMGPDHIGLSSTMDESEQLRTIFEQTKDVWGPGVKELREQQQQYRRELERKHAEANATLSDAFWYFVYNNPHISRQELEFHLKHREGNPQLQSLTETHQSTLDSLYLRIKFIHSHPAVNFWFVFWDDVYARNGEMKGIRKCKADFEPLQPTAICYHVMRRPDLESWLCKRRLVGNRRLFHSRLLDLLYSQMNKRLENKNA